MEHHSFFPRSTRNRIALMLGLLSLILFFTWNLMPNYEICMDVYEREGFVFQSLWPQVFTDLVEGFQSPTMNEESVVSLLCLLLILQVIVMLSILPGWKFWQSTLILRIIPAFMIIVCGLILTYFLLKNIERPLPQVITLTIMDVNIFATALSLFFFKNEYIAPIDHGNSST